MTAAAVAGLIPRWRARASLREDVAILAVPNVVVTSPQPGKSTAGITLPAEVRPLIEAPIYARANGFLRSWLVDIGAKVEAGQVLAEIDTPELDQELARSRAESHQAEAALELAKISAARWAELLKTSSVSEQEAAEKHSDLALKSATLEAARANVRRLEELKSFSHVTAPFAGTITARRTDVGELIMAGSAKELFRLAQTATLRVYAHVPQTSVRAIVLGTERSDDYSRVARAQYSGPGRSHFGSDGCSITNAPGGTGSGQFLRRYPFGKLRPSALPRRADGRRADPPFKLPALPSRRTQVGVVGARRSG